MVQQATLINHHQIESPVAIVSICCRYSRRIVSGSVAEQKRCVEAGGAGTGEQCEAERRVVQCTHQIHSGVAVELDLRRPSASGVPTGGKFGSSGETFHRSTPEIYRHCIGARSCEVGVCCSRSVPAASTGVAEQWRPCWVVNVATCSSFTLPYVID